jgi:Mg-chelatase subunit ChlD
MTKLSIELTNPWALVLLVLIPAAIYLARKSLANLTRGRAAASITVRVILLLLIVLAVAGLRMRLASRDVAVIFLVDVSASVAQSERRVAIDLINNEIERAGPRDYIGVIAFAREATVEVTPTRKELLGQWRLTEISSNPANDYTNVAGALRLASALVPEDAAGRIVLLSDGNENLESAANESQLLRADQIEVYTHSLRTLSERGEQRGEVAVRELVAPEIAGEDEAFELKVSVDSTADTDAVLRVFRNDSVIAERDVQLAAAGENVFVLPQRNDEKGFYTYRAEIETRNADSFVQNNSREAFTIVQGRPKTLYLYGDPQPSPAMLRVLTEGGFAASIRSQQAMPTTLAGFQDYDLVIFDNVPATSLTTVQMKMVQSYVRDLGGGFIMIGGEQSFGPGGYYKTTIEDVLPVSLDVRQKKHFPSLALALVIDRSGSMSGDKMRLAIEAAVATVEFLAERDSVTVIAFDGEPHTIVDLTHVEDKQSIISRIRAIQEGGGTNLYPALKAAYDRLSASDAQIKHVIALSDGMSEPGDFPGIANSISKAGMTLTSVAVGSDADVQTMGMLAQLGGGRFYAAEDEESLPRIFTREAFLASRATIIEEPFVPKLIRPSQATAGIDWNSAPALGGYVGTAERDASSTPAITSLVSDKDDPVYAVWQYGLGRSAAFTSDAKPRWAAGWMDWPGLGRFWTQAFREVLRKEGSNDLASRVEIDAGTGKVTVEALTSDGRFRNNLKLRAHLVAPDLSTSDIILEQTAAGQYEGQFPATARGAYLVSVTEENGQSAQVTGAVNSYSPEFAISNTDANLLSHVSEATEGRVINGADWESVNLFEQKRTKTRPREIWQSLMLIALLLLPLDVGIRRLHITREEVVRVREWLKAKFTRADGADIDAEAVASLGQLKASRGRLRLGADDAVGADSASQIRVANTGLESGEMLSRSSLESKSVKTRSERAVAASDSPSTEPANPLASRLLEARRKKRTEE